MLLGVGVGVVAAGLLLRMVPGPVGDLGGGAFYAALVFVLVAAAAPAASGTRLGAVAFLLCAGVELLQLTGLPAALADAFPPARLLLGTTFAATDLLAYVIGASVAVTLDHILRRRRRQR